MFGSLSNSEIETLLHSQVVGGMGCHADNLTYVVPISYAYDGTYIYTRTFEGMKVNIIRKSPEVCFQVDDMHDLANWQSVIAWGTVEELSGKEQCGKALEILSARVLPFLSSETMHLSPVWPFSAGSESIPGIFLRILLERKTGRFERLEPASFFAS